MHNDDMITRGEGFSRRTVLKGAAWSAPVIALAVASPAASASGTITIDFVAVVLKLHRSTALNVLVRITNNTAVDVNDTATIILTGIPDEVMLRYDDTQTEYVAPDDSNTSNTPVTNQDFTLLDHDAGDDSYTFLSNSALSIAAGESEYFFFGLEWPAENPQVQVFVIAGSLTFGTGNGAISGVDTVEIDPDGAQTPG